MITAGPLSTTDLAVAVRASIRGDVVTPGHPSFPAATFGVTGAAPEVVVVAADAQDVARTVVLAGRTGRRLVAQTVGRPTTVPGGRTILVVTRLLAKVQVDAGRRTATVGIGASWRQVLDAAEPFGLTALSSHGDRGSEVRRRSTVFAFAADRIRSFEVITATGSRRQVGPDSPEFSALRSGQTAPGLVVAMTIDLLPHPSLTVAELSFAAANSARALAGWRQLSARLPATVVTGVAAGSDGALLVRFGHLGTPEHTVGLLTALRAALGVAPIGEVVAPTTVAAVARWQVGRNHRLAA